MWMVIEDCPNLLFVRPFQIETKRFVEQSMVCQLMKSIGASIAGPWWFWYFNWRCKLMNTSFLRFDRSSSLLIKNWYNTSLIVVCNIELVSERHRQPAFAAMSLAFESWFRIVMHFKQAHVILQIISVDKLLTYALNFEVTNPFWFSNWVHGNKLYNWYNLILFWWWYRNFMDCVLKIYIWLIFLISHCLIRFFTYCQNPLACIFHFDLRIGITYTVHELINVIIEAFKCWFLILLYFCFDQVCISIKLLQISDHSI